MNCARSRRTRRRSPTRWRTRRSWPASRKSALAHSSAARDAALRAANVSLLVRAQDGSQSRRARGRAVPRHLQQLFRAARRDRRGRSARARRISRDRSARELCCGRPLYDQGMLERAKARLKEAMDVLGPFVARGCFDRRPGAELHPDFSRRTAVAVPRRRARQARSRRIHFCSTNSLCARSPDFMPPRVAQANDRAGALPSEVARGNR